MRMVDDDLAQVDGHRLARGDGRDGLLLDVVLQQVDGRVGGDHLLGQLDVAAQTAPRRVRERGLGAACHVADELVQGLEIGIVGGDGVRLHVRLQGRSALRRWAALSRTGR